MDDAAVRAHITTTFPDAEVLDAMGYTFFFYKSDRMRPFATMASADNEHDRVSNLDRPGVFRLNVGVGKETYRALVGEAKSAADFTVLDRIMPHPDYAAQRWVCVLCPSEETFEVVRRLLGEAYEIARRRFDRAAR